MPLEGLGGVVIAVLSSMIHPKQLFSDGLGGASISIVTPNMHPYNHHHPQSLADVYISQSFFICFCHTSFLRI